MKKKKIGLEAGELVTIRFLDHCESDGDPAPILRCRTVGWVIEETCDAILIESWGIEEPADLNTAPNRKTFTIAKMRGMVVCRAFEDESHEL